MLATKRKRTLSGYLPDGSVVRIRTAAEYSHITVVPDGGWRPSKRHYDASAPARYAKPGDIVVGLTEAHLDPHGPFISIRRADGVIWTYPRCYACDKPGLKVCGTFDHKKLPACAGRHAGGYAA